MAKWARMDHAPAIYIKTRLTCRKTTQPSLIIAVVALNLATFFVKYYIYFLPLQETNPFIISVLAVRPFQFFFLDFLPDFYHKLT